MGKNVDGNSDQLERNQRGDQDFFFGGGTTERNPVRKILHLSVQLEIEHTFAQLYSLSSITRNNRTVCVRSGEA